MQELLHLVGICPDSMSHLSILKVAIGGIENINTVLQYVKHILK